MAMMQTWLRGLRLAVWLGWQVESNWADPFLFAVYTIVRPLSGLLLLFFMYYVLSGGQQGPLLYYFLIGSALWPYVVQSLQGIAFTVVEDREEYRMIRYLYMAPAPYAVYLVGRAIARAAVATVAVVFTLSFSVLVLGLPLRRDVVDLPYTLAAFGLGFVGMWAMGMIVAALTMNLTQSAWSMPEAVGGALYLLAGAIFPISQLPAPLAALGSLLPVTYWLEALRRGLLGSTVGSFPALSNEAVFVRLIVSTIGAVIFAYAVFGWGQRLAKTTGNLDRTSNY